MPRSTSSRLRFGRISRETGGAVRQASRERREMVVNNTLLLEMEKQVPRSRGNRSGPLRGTSRRRPVWEPGLLAGCLTLPRAVFIIDCLAPCFHLPGFTQSKPGGQMGPPWVLPVPSRACRRAGLGQSPSFLGLAAPHTPRAERPPCTAALPPGRSVQPCSLTS